MCLGRPALWTGTHNRHYCCGCAPAVCWGLQEKQAAEAGQQAGPNTAFDAADEARLQEQLQELSSKIAQLDEGEQQRAVSLRDAGRRETATQQTPAWAHGHTLCYVGMGCAWLLIEHDCSPRSHCADQACCCLCPAELTDLVPKLSGAGGAGCKPEEVSYYETKLVVIQVGVAVGHTNTAGVSRLCGKRHGCKDTCCEQLLSMSLLLQ